MADELDKAIADVERGCQAREFRLDQIAKDAKKRALEAETRTKGIVSGADRLEAERRAAEFAEEAAASEKARLSMEEAHRAKSLQLLAMERRLHETITSGQARADDLEQALASAREALAAAEQRACDEAESSGASNSPGDWEIQDSWAKAPEFCKTTVAQQLSQSLLAVAGLSLALLLDFVA
ncbi:unnamed protein product, partial [Polarella glacialis]